MKIVDFKREHIDKAKVLIQSNYNEERLYVDSLPALQNVLDLSQFSDNGFSVAAVEKDEIIGVLCSYPPFDNAFSSTSAKGIFSPMGANAAIKENREKIYAAMYQSAAEKWVDSGATSHALCLYAHDEELHHEFFRLGFGIRCMDAIRPMTEIGTPFVTGYSYKELSLNDSKKVYPLYVQLYMHYRKSPFFMNRKEENEHNFISCAKKENSRFFAAYYQDEICAYYEINKCGETSICDDRNYLHINGAFCIPEFRGKGVAQNLLNYAIQTLKADGYTMLGVDFESINPTAYGFWIKYFTPYTHSVVRRIDESILNIR